MKIACTPMPLIVCYNSMERMERLQTRINTDFGSILLKKMLLKLINSKEIA